MTAPSNPFAAAFALPSSASGGSTTSNPFAATVLTAPSFPAAASNPFKGFDKLTTPAPTASSVSFPTVAVTNPSIAPVAAASSSVPTSSNGSSNGTSEYVKKMKKLNESFLRWVERQVKENPVAIWKDGVKDYLKHQNMLRSTYDSEASTTPAASSTTANIPEKASSIGTTTSNSTFSSSSSSAPKTSAPAFQFGTSAPSTSSESQTTKPMFSLSAGAASTSSSNSLPAFSLGNTATKPADASKPISFSLPGTTASAAPTTAPTFSFNLPTNTAAAPLATSSGFNFSFAAPPAAAGNAFTFKPSPAPAASLASTGGEDGDENNGDEEGEPILAPEKVLRNDQDTDTIVLEVTCKLFNYNKADKEWKDTGKGNFRITQDPATKKKRMVMRNGTGKIILNASFFKTFKAERVKGGLKFSAFVAKETTGEAEFKMFMTKLNDANCDKLKAAMDQAVTELP